MREYRALQRAPGPAQRSGGVLRRADGPVDRPPHAHHGVRRRLPPAELVARAAAAGVTVLGVTDHDTVAALRGGRRGLPRTPASSSCPASRSRRSHDERRRPRPRLFHRSRSRRPARSSSPSSGGGAIDRVRADGRAAAGARHRRSTPMPILQPALDDSRKSVGPTRGSPGPWSPPATCQTTDEAFDRWLARGRPGVRAARRRAPPEEVFAADSRAPAESRRSRTRGCFGATSGLPDFVAAGLDALEAYHTDHDAAATMRYLRHRRTASGCAGPAAPTTTPTRRMVGAPGQRRAAARRLRSASATARRQPRHRIGRGHLFVEQHIESVEALPQFAGLEQVIRRGRPPAEGALAVVNVS